MPVRLELDVQNEWEENTHTHKLATCRKGFVLLYLKKNQNAHRPSEHPPVRGENVKTFRCDYRLQIQNLFMAFKGVPLCYGSDIGSTV